MDDFVRFKEEIIKSWLTQEIIVNFIILQLENKIARL